jgi:hypothetical protein
MVHSLQTETSQQQVELTPEQEQAVATLQGGTPKTPEDLATETWQDALFSRLNSDIRTYSAAAGLNKNQVLFWFQGLWPSLVSDLTQSIERGGFGPNFDPASVGGLATLNGVARYWMTSRSPSMAQLWRVSLGVDEPLGGGGGGGARRPTAAQIRQSFDVDQLANRVIDLWRGYLFEEPKAPRELASAYVEQIVANPDQKLDFDTFVYQRIKNTGRYGLLYRQKGEGVSEAQFLQPYIQSAMQAVGPGRPGQLEGLVTAGARLGADPQAFRGLLARQRQVQNSAPFIQGLEERLTAVRGVLRG